MNTPLKGSTVGRAGALAKCITLPRTYLVQLRGELLLEEKQNRRTRSERI
jgi:hypothetical protein